MVVEVGASGVCHTDVAVLQGDIPLPLPLVLGHEGAGTVREVGTAVTALKPGDRVIGMIGAVCGPAGSAPTGRPTSAPTAAR